MKLEQLSKRNRSSASASRIVSSVRFSIQPQAERRGGSTGSGKFFIRRCWETVKHPIALYPEISFILIYIAMWVIFFLVRPRVTDAIHVTRKFD
jgi:hypothetical protein